MAASVGRRSRRLGLPGVRKTLPVAVEHRLVLHLQVQAPDIGRKLAWQACGLQASTSMTPNHSKASSKPRLRARWLNVYGYTPTDLLCLHDAVSGLVLLYIPGNASPLHEFSDKHAMLPPHRAEVAHRRGRPSVA